MFETFTKNYIAENEKINSHTLQKFVDHQNGSRLWLACRRSWLLQRIDFNIITATPQKLSCIGNILPYIYQVMAGNPPDSKTIADELAIGDSFFIDEVITELIRLGVLEVDSTGRTAITDLGQECCSRGEIPGGSRRQRISLCFDPVSHEFPDQPLFTDSDRTGNQANSSRHIVPDYHLADANRIDLDTIREIAALQNLLSTEDTVIFDAEPDEAETEAGIYHKEVYVLVFLKDDGQISLHVHDPHSQSTSRWHQEVIDDRLKEGTFDFSHLFGPLAADAPAGVDSNGDLDGLSPIPVYQVQEKIVAAVKQADQSLFMHTLGFGSNVHGNTDDLWNAIYEAADRGVDCKLLWDGVKINDNAPVHKNITNADITNHPDSNGTHEFLIVDDKVAFVCLVSKLTLSTGDPVASALRVYQSKNQSVYRKLKQSF